MRRNKLIYFGLVILFLISCSKTKKEHVDQKNLTISNHMTYYKEPYRPQFHFSPKEKWMNDPNGLVYHKGIYHLFYQYYPEDIVWGPMHWGHATSKDLIHWKHKPIALYPDEHGYIFSGSAVIDKENSSGFGTNENPPLVAIFTYHLAEGEKAGRNDFQTQGIAYSLDNGESWTKYKKNPIINNTGIKDFRDPKVFWHDELNQWIMVLVAGDHAKFYKSSNLKEWELTGGFGKDNGAHGGVWECPDLFKLKIQETNEEKWVLLISINPGAPNGGSGTQYFVGNFDGKTFIPEHLDIKWLDYGTDNYAGVTYNNAPNNERIFIGWMGNWNYAQKTPTMKWRSAMTLPRTLTLHKENNGYYLKNYPVKAFDKQLEIAKENNEILISTKYKIDTLDLSQSEISFSIDTKNLEALTLSFKNKKNILHFIMNTKNGVISLNKMNSGKVDFEERFASSIHKLPFSQLKGSIDFRFILDKSSIEIFIDKGKHVMTEQIFPDEAYNELEISHKGNITLKNFKISKIKSIWNHEK